MKNLILLLLLLGNIVLFAQEADRFTQDNHQSDRPRDPRMDQYNYVSNEVLVKFKDHVQINAGTQLKSAGVSAVDQVLGNYGIQALQKLFPSETKLKSAKVVKNPQGRDMEIPSLHNIFKIQLPELKSSGNMPVNIQQVIEELQTLPEVEYAEPNYIYTIGGLNPVGPVLTADDLQKQQATKSANTGVVPNDPLYAQQGHIPAIKADLVWAQTTGDSSQVIAILDTGVDWNHPDLKNKIWRNPNEIANGQDTDGNGFIDDIRGWNFVNNDNNPMDDNSHGTHVAGIAAAESNNGIGIAGVNWHAKIMPVKVFQSTGRGDASTIAQGINYASNKNVGVINMSFGGYFVSQTMEAVLQNAISKGCILVAAAGNDNFSIYDNDLFGNSKAFFPAAYSFVLGVQANNIYSNYDPDGPVFSEFDQDANYEIVAPGSILSTVLNGNYRHLQGTSMAAPIVSGAVSLYQSSFPDKTLEELWSDFIHTSNNLFNVENALYGTTKKPVLDLKSFDIVDVCENCDEDNHADAGEIVNITIKARNTGSPAEQVYAKLLLRNDGDPDDIEIVKDSSYLGNIGVYRTLNNENDPFKVKINENCFNNRTIMLDVQLHSASNLDTSTTTIHFKIYNGEELSGILLSDTILTPDKNWVITNSLRIDNSVTLTILPGTSVEIIQGVDNRGKVIAVGTQDDRITMKGAIGGYAIYKYADIDLNGSSFSSNQLEYCNIVNAFSIQASRISYSKIEYLYGTNPSAIDTIYRSILLNSSFFPGTTFPNIFESVFENYTIGGSLFYKNGPVPQEFKYNIFNKLTNWTYKHNYWQYEYFEEQNKLHEIESIFMRDYDGYNGKITKNSFLKNGVNTYFLNTAGDANFAYLEGQYWGSNDPQQIRKKYKDFQDNSSVPYFQYEPKLEAPSDSCHAHVWKVLVNGKDAQDEVVDPLGVGKHRFDVYFNRPMKKDLPPKVTFGGMYPYTSIPVNEDGSWSEDGKIYTVYKTIKLTNADGINRIRVAGAMQDADWGWEIPVEDQRFNFIIAAASSASLEFQATPGLGKVALEWNHNDLADGLGYNMYRMEHVNDSVLTQPVLVNNSLITDTLYTDFSVVPNEKYYYYYKILRTNFAETDSSRVVSAIPFTASKGDANGDLAVNVLDITSIVAYMLLHNPQPFIFEAADVNSDATINVLDIVGTVNIILNDGNKSGFVQGNSMVELFVQNDTLFANSPVSLSGLQFNISGVNNLTEIEILQTLKGFEQGHVQSDNELMVFFFSMTGKSVAAGNRIPLIKLQKGSGISKVVLGDMGGNELYVELSTLTSAWNVTEDLKEEVAVLGQNYPNPFNEFTIIPFTINEPVEEAVIRIFNVQGVEVYRQSIKKPMPGEHLVEWQGAGRQGLYAYILEISRRNQRVITGMNKMIAK